MTTVPTLFKSSLSGASTRQAVFEQTKASAWLYLTGPAGSEPVAMCLLYDTGEEAARGDDEPPPLDPRYASESRVEPAATEDDVDLLWSPGGEAVAAVVGGLVAGFIESGELLGYSRSVSRDCAWAHPFDLERFQRLFHPPC